MELNILSIIPIHLITTFVAFYKNAYFLSLCMLFETLISYNYWLNPIPNSYSYFIDKYMVAYLMFFYLYLCNYNMYLLAPFFLILICYFQSYKVEDMREDSMNWWCLMHIFVFIFNNNILMYSNFI